MNNVPDYSSLNLQQPDEYFNSGGLPPGISAGSAKEDLNKAVNDVRHRLKKLLKSNVQLKPEARKELKSLSGKLGKLKMTRPRSKCKTFKVVNERVEKLEALLSQVSVELVSTAKDVSQQREALSTWWDQHQLDGEANVLNVAQNVVKEVTKRISAQDPTDSSSGNIIGKVRGASAMALRAINTVAEQHTHKGDSGGAAAKGVPQRLSTIWDQVKEKTNHSNFAETTRPSDGEAKANTAGLKAEVAFEGAKMVGSALRVEERAQGLIAKKKSSLSELKSEITEAQRALPPRGEVEGGRDPLNALLGLVHSETSSKVDELTNRFEADLAEAKTTKKALKLTDKYEKGVQKVLLQAAKDLGEIRMLTDAFAGHKAALTGTELEATSTLAAGLSFCRAALREAAPSGRVEPSSVSALLKIVKKTRESTGFKDYMKTRGQITTDRWNKGLLVSDELYAGDLPQGDAAVVEAVQSMLDDHRLTQITEDIDNFRDEYLGQLKEGDPIIKLFTVIKESTEQALSSHLVELNTALTRAGGSKRKKAKALKRFNKAINLTLNTVYKDRRQAMNLVMDYLSPQTALKEVAGKEEKVAALEAGAAAFRTKLDKIIAEADLSAPLSDLIEQIKGASEGPEATSYNAVIEEIRDGGGFSRINPYMQRFD